jgi:hypothetical protein
MRRLLLSLMLLCSLFAGVLWGQKPEPRVKTSRTGVSGELYLKGVVGKIDSDGMTVVEVVGPGEGREHKLVPTDMLREGARSESANGRFSYLWADVKQGDEVEVVYNTDHIDKLTYCVEVCIQKRPKAKLPAWQEMKNPDDKRLFAQLSMFNDLSNGEDVSDDDIKTLFPPRPKRVDGGGVPLPAHPGGLPRDYQAKLDAIRAKKKETEVKATPPEKKGDKK